MAYDQRYDDPQLRDLEEPRPWDLLEIVKQYARENHLLLDIGCGTAKKLIPLTQYVRDAYGLEPNPDMRTKAMQNIAASGVKNITLVAGRAEEIPFAENHFDVITSMLAPHNTYEAYRVLKAGGYCIVERTGEKDKYDLKKEFGIDEHGWRGQNFSCQPMANMFFDQFAALFSEVGVREGFWDSYLTMEGLILLLEQTPSVRGFDKEKDSDILQRIEHLYGTERGIRVQQHRILIVARK